MAIWPSDVRALGIEPDKLGSYPGFNSSTNLFKSIRWLQVEVALLKLKPTREHSHQSEDGTFQVPPFKKDTSFGRSAALGMGSSTVNPAKKLGDDRISSPSDWRYEMASDWVPDKACYYPENIATRYIGQGIMNAFSLTYPPGGTSLTLTC